MPGAPTSRIGRSRGEGRPAWAARARVRRISAMGRGKGRRRLGQRAQAPPGVPRHGAQRHRRRERLVDLPLGAVVRRLEGLEHGDAREHRAASAPPRARPGAAPPAAGSVTSARRAESDRPLSAEGTKRSQRSAQSRAASTKCRSRAGAAGSARLRASACWRCCSASMQASAACRQSGPPRSATIRVAATTRSRPCAKREAMGAKAQAKSSSPMSSPGCTARSPTRAGKSGERRCSRSASSRAAISSFSSTSHSQSGAVASSPNSRMEPRVREAAWSRPGRRSRVSKLVSAKTELSRS